uniref:Mucosa-associated lymphoid tissue lymphoma translocation protein 1 homolog n=1 Tax=Cacopsylla melanoneura TaxID=428564 RepID=A0A8D8XA77_9HEMI
MSQDFKTLSSTLETCPYKVFVSFQNCLDTADNWKLFVKSLPIIGKELSPHEVNLLSQEANKIGGSPARSIWFKLQSWLITCHQLIAVLRHSQLLEPLLILVGPEPLEIVTQPGEDEEDRLVDYGSRLTLNCEAKGLPPPQYQWFHNNVALEGKNQTTLDVNQLSNDHTGAYYCQVSHTLPNTVEEVKLFSNFINITVKPPIPVITSQSSELQAVHCGNSVLLRVFTVPPPEEIQINWYHKNKLLSDEHSSVLHLDNISPHHEGHYLCEVSNSSGTVYSRDMNLVVLPQYNTPCAHDPPRSSVSEEDEESPNQASCKMALLVANDAYLYMQNLKTPCSDIARIATILESLDFVVFAVCNLTKAETVRYLDQFCTMVPPKAYLFFYYVGHGFLMYDKYFMPVDCSETEFLRAECVCDKQVMRALLHTDPQLIVFVLDMCLVRPEREINPAIYREEVASEEQDSRLDSACSIFEAFATRSQSYERSNQPLGIYAHHLVKFLADKSLSVSKIFLEAHADLIKNNLETNQRPLICVDAASKFKLSDSFSSVIHKKVVDLFSLFTTIKKSNHKLHLKPWNTKLSVVNTQHKCFLNVLSVVFNTELTLECKASDEGLLVQLVSTDNGQQTYLIHHLQRVNEKLELRIRVISSATDPDPTSETSEEYSLSLGRPLIVRSLSKPYTQSKWKNYQQSLSKPATKP